MCPSNAIYQVVQHFYTIYITRTQVIIHVSDLLYHAFGEIKTSAQNNINKIKYTQFYSLALIFHASLPSASLQTDCVRVNKKGPCALNGAPRHADVGESEHLLPRILKLSPR